MKLLKHKNTVPKLDDQTASALLQNVFASCNTEPNTIPLNILVSYSNYRRERYIPQKATALLALLLLLFLPLLFIL